MSEYSSSNNSDASSSEDEGQQNVEISGFRLHITKAKLDEIVKEGLTHAPFLERDAIVNLYKEYMENESILFNKLKMMANDRKNSENDNEGWIVQTGGFRPDTKDHHRSQFQKEEEALKLKYRNYNFLEDRELLERVEKRKVETRKYRDADYDAPRNDYQEERNGRKEKPATRYVEKKQVNTSADNIDKKKQNKQPEKPQEKPERVQEKPQPKASKYIEKKEEEPQQKAEVKVQKPAEEIKKAAPETTKKPTESARKEEPKAQPVEQPKEQPKKPVETKPAVSLDQKLTETKPSEIPSPSKTSEVRPITSTSSIKSYDANQLVPADVLSNFGQAVKDNVYVLSFIKPNSKKQLVEYIALPNSTAPSKVSVRVLAD